MTNVAVHKYIYRRKKRTGKCQHCRKKGKTEFAKIKGRKYTKRTEDYLELCPKCHRKYDGLGELLKRQWKDPEFRKKKINGMKDAWTDERRLKLIKRNHDRAKKK